MELRGGLLRNLVALVCLSIIASSLLLLLHSSLPDVSPNSPIDAASDMKLLHEKSLKEKGLGKLGEMMVEMLPDDLAFTVFVPSEDAFERVLKLGNDSFGKQKMNDTFAIISRVMGFSAVPWHVPSSAVPLRKEISLDSISGFRLYAWRAADGTLLVNNVISERVDIRKAEIIVHIVKGVIMDAEFEQAFSSDYQN